LHVDFLPIKLSLISSRLTFLNPEELLVNDASAPAAVVSAQEGHTASYGDGIHADVHRRGTLKLSDYQGKVVLVELLGDVVWSLCG